MTGGTNRVRQGRGSNASNWRFIRGVDIRHDEQVRLIEGAAEVVPKVLRARKAMRLKEHEQPLITAAPRSFQRGTYFHWMMAIIIDQSNAAHRAFNLKAPPNTRKRS